MFGGGFGLGFGGGGGDGGAALAQLEENDRWLAAFFGAGGAIPEEFRDAVFGPDFVPAPPAGIPSSLPSLPSLPAVVVVGGGGGDDMAGHQGLAGVAPFFGQPQLDPLTGFVVPPAAGAAIEEGGEGGFGQPGQLPFGFALEPGTGQAGGLANPQAGLDDALVGGGGGGGFVVNPEFLGGLEDPFVDHQAQQQQQQQQQQPYVLPTPPPRADTSSAHSGTTSDETSQSDADSGDDPLSPLVQASPEHQNDGAENETEADDETEAGSESSESDDEEDEEDEDDGDDDKDDEDDDKDDKDDQDDKGDKDDDGDHHVEHQSPAPSFSGGHQSEPQSPAHTAAPDQAPGPFTTPWQSAAYLAAADQPGPGPSAAPGATQPSTPFLENDQLTVSSLPPSPIRVPDDMLFHCPDCNRGFVLRHNYEK